MSEVKINSINLHAGHNAPGEVACGAVGLIDESAEARRIVRWIQYYATMMGKTVHNCTINHANSEADNLKKIVDKCNRHRVDLDVSIHLNCGAKDVKGNGKTCGCEVLVTANEGVKKSASFRIRKNLEDLGFQDRGTKQTGNLYVLNHTNAKAMLVEVFFVDDKDDVELYKKISSQVIGRKIAEAIFNEKVGTKYRTNYNLRIRKKPSLTGRIIGKAKKGETIYVTHVNKDGWGKVRYKGGYGYIRIKTPKKTYCEKR